MEESKENDFSSFSPCVLPFSPKQSKMGWMKKIRTIVSKYRDDFVIIGLNLIIFVLAAFLKKQLS